MENYQIICRDNIHLVSGTFRNTNETGAVVFSPGVSPDPVFGINSKISVDILNETTGQSTCVDARLARAIREPNGWTYLLRWNGMPQILKNP